MAVMTQTRKLSNFDTYQLRIAQQTLQMSDREMMLRQAMTKGEARQTVERLTATSQRGKIEPD